MKQNDESKILNDVSQSAPNINETRTIVDDPELSKEAIELSIDLMANEESQRPRNIESSARG